MNDIIMTSQSTNHLHSTTNGQPMESHNWSTTTTTLQNHVPLVRTQKDTEGRVSGVDEMRKGGAKNGRMVQDNLANNTLLPHLPTIDHCPTPPKPTTVSLEGCWVNLIGNKGIQEVRNAREKGTKETLTVIDTPSDNMMLTTSRSEERRVGKEC